MNERERPPRSAGQSVLALALRVLRGELTEAEAVEIIRDTGNMENPDH